MKRRTKYLLALTAVVVLTTAVSTLLVWLHPAQVAVSPTGAASEPVKLLPSCPFHTLTGLYCPGFGSTRAIHYLLTGDWRRSLRANPLLLPLLPFLAFLLFRFFYEGIAERTLPVPCLREISVTLLVLLCVFWLLRNIPLECFDWMRPDGL